MQQEEADPCSCGHAEARRVLWRHKVVLEAVDEGELRERRKKRRRLVVAQADVAPGDAPPPRLG